MCYSNYETQVHTYKHNIVVKNNVKTYVCMHLDTVLLILCTCILNKLTLAR